MKNLTYSILNILFLILILSSCSWGTHNNIITSVNTGTITQDPSNLMVPIVSPEIEFKEIIKKLEDTKNYDDFLQKYSSISSKIDEWVRQGRGKYIFNHSIVDKIIPFIYICRLTLSGNESTIRSNFLLYGTVIPPITMSNNAAPQDILLQFVSSEISLATLYSILLSSQVSLPQYFVDLISSRNSTQGKMIDEDCGVWIYKYEKQFFN